MESEVWKAFQRHPNEETFGPLYEGTKKLVYTICFRILRNPDDAADAFQSVYCRLLATAKDPESSLAGADLDPFVGRLAVREANNLRDRRRRRQTREAAMETPPDSADSAFSPDRIAASREIRDKIEALSSLLPEKYRLPLLLHYFDGLTQIEIARMLDIPEGTIRNRVSLGLKKLRPLMRRAGLGDATLTLGAILAGAHLLKPPASLGAAAVFAHANALLVSGSAAGVLTSGAATGAGVGTGAMVKSLGGAILMKTKIATVAAVLVALILVLRQLDKSDAPPTLEKPRSALQTEADEERKPEPRTVVPTPPIDAETFDAIAAEFADSETPAWSAEIEPIERGFYRYWLYVDGFQIPDPLNSWSDPWRQESGFLWPPAARGDKASVPRVLSPNRALFIYEGTIERSALFIAPFRGGWWGTDEFRPLNDAARENLKRILADRTLGGIKGRVVDRNRRPVAGARVRLLDMPGSDERDEEVHIRTVVCDAQGRFRALRLPRVRTAAVGRAAGFAQGVSVVAVSSIDTTPDVEIVLRRTALVGGRVTDEAGTPVRDAVVSANRIPRDLSPCGPMVYTDAEGRYLFESLRPGHYEFRIRAAGFAAAVEGGIRVSGEWLKREPDVDVILTRGATLRGRVIRRSASKDGRETPVENADVLLEGPLIGPAGIAGGYHGLELHTHSDSNGAFVIEHVNFGVEYTCYAMLNGSPSEKRLQVCLDQDREPDEVVLHFPPPGGLAGRVFDTAHKPVVGAHVRLCSPQLGSVPSELVERSIQWRGMALYVKAVSDEAGRFKFEGLSKGVRYEADVRAEGFAPVRVGNLIAGSPIQVEIVLRPAASISGTVIDGDSEAPLAGVQIRAFVNSDDYEFGLSTAPKATTGGDGTFVFRDVPGGLYYMDVRGEVNGKDYAVLPAPEKLIRVGEGKAVENVVLRARACATVKGTVLAKVSREPVEGVTVAMGDLTLGHITLTGADGTFTLTHVPAGRVTLGAEPSYLGFKGKLEIETAPGETVEGVELLLDAGGSISGIVVDEHGTPVPNVNLKLLGSHDWGQVSDLDGRFRYEGLRIQPVTDTVYRVVTHPQFEKNYRGETTPIQFTEENLDVEVTLVVSPGSSISGRVIDTEDRPITGASVAVSDPSGFPRHADTNHSGRYRIGAIEPGDRTMTIYHEDYKRVEGHKITLAERQDLDGIDFQLEEKEVHSQWFIRGVLLDLRGRPMGTWTVFAQPELEQGLKSFSTPVRPNTTTAHDGTFEIGGLADGRYTMRFAPSMGPPSIRLPGSYRGPEQNPTYQTQGVESVEADAPGTAREQVFVVACGAVVKGQLVFEGSGEPVPQGHVRIQYKTEGMPELPADETPGVGDGLCLCVGYSQEVEIRKNDQGFFQVEDLPVGAFEIWISSSQALPKHLAKVIPGDGFVADLGEIALAAGKWIRMRLVNARTGEPYNPPDPDVGPRKTGLRIRGRRTAGPWSGRGDFWLHPTRPDADGVLTARPVPDDLASLQIQADEYFPKTISPIELDDDGETDLGTIALDPGHTIHMRLVDGATGKPIPGSPAYPPLQIPCLQVSGVRANGYAASGWKASQPEARGRATITLAPDDLTTLTLVCLGYLPHTIHPIELDPSGETDLGVVEFDPGHKVVLRLVDMRTGEPIPGVAGQIRLVISGLCANGHPPAGWHGSQPDAQGVVTVAGTPFDLTTMTINCIGYLPRDICPVRLNPGAETGLGDVILDPGQMVRGRIVGPHGENVHAAYVAIRAGEGKGVHRATRTDANGEFAVGGLPAGPATVDVTVQRWRDLNSWIEVGRNQVRLEAVPITIRADGETRIELRFPARRPQSP